MSSCSSYSSIYFYGNYSNILSSLNKTIQNIRSVQRMSCVMFIYIRHQRPTLVHQCTNLRTFAYLPLLLSIQRLPCPEHCQARRIKFEHLLLFPYIVQHRQAWLSNGWHCCWYAHELLYFWGTGLILCLCLAVLEGSPGKIGDFLTLHWLFDWRC